MSFFCECFAESCHRLPMGDWMGYKIVYSKEKSKKHKILRLQALIAAFLLLFSIYVRISWPAGRAFLQSVLVSDSLSHGAEAVMALLENLEAGDSISDAVAVFCQEIFYGG